MKHCIVLIHVFLVLCQHAESQLQSQWRGPDRNGVFPESGLLKSWPENGPELLWMKNDLGRGLSSVSVTDSEIFVTGLEDSTEYLTALDLNGNQRWRLPYGLSGKTSYPDSRCTPTVEKDHIYLISGRGEVVCVNRAEKKIQWKVPAFEKYQGKHWIWGIAESPLIVDDKVIFTPGGPQTTMIALDKNTGETVWETQSLDDTSSFTSPTLVHFGGKKIIVNLTIKYLLGVDADDGRILWNVTYSDIETPTFHLWAPRNNCITPLYHDGHLFITSGYDHVGVMFKLINEGNDIQQVWVNPTLDCHHGQVVRVGNYIYGTNWINNQKGNWCCIDWTTGNTMYEKEWHTKGSISAADNMLYCYEERRGNLALVEPSPDEFKIISSFRITEGSGPHWAQPVIRNGIMYIRHGNVLMAYNIKK